MDTDPAHLRRAEGLALAAIIGVGERNAVGNRKDRPSAEALANLKDALAGLSGDARAKVLGFAMGHAFNRQVEYASHPDWVVAYELLAGLYEEAGADVGAAEAVHAAQLAEVERRGYW
jgi:hypothetical protein